MIKTREELYKTAEEIKDSGELVSIDRLSPALFMIISAEKEGSKIRVTLELP